ncbi:hypothetical protein DUNSADRAFT_9084 [Dunaliella salina]|uniref:Uncharacterized protein n=1 Tax=Dunaliella salina TaxID=3046 RepID=A0ABQ7H5J6_DUNSA|nr:hypothetical protein DUNSADRAFT_9084 [Dunaliella salina]|eukprot:KAF5842125.1 hypothetical protein DUNSADRAFT_9084 [Dunaliella salina]
MQSHASRHVVSDFLKDLHPDLSPPGFPKEVIKDEIAVRRNSCEALASLALVLTGRSAIAKADGMASLTGALLTAPEAAARALRHFSMSRDGLGLLNQVLDLVVPALAELVMRPKEDGISLKACENAVSTMAGVATMEAGCMACLTYRVPRAVVSLVRRGISGDFKFEPTLMDCLEQCASCLDQIAHHPLGKLAVMEAEGIPVLGKMLPLCSYHPSALLKTTSTLMGCSVEKECKLDIMRYAGFELIQLLRNSSDERVVSNARDTLKSSAEHLEARACMTSMLTERQQVEFVFKGPLPPSPPDFRYKVTLPGHAQ